MQTGTGNGSVSPVRVATTTPAAPAAVRALPDAAQSLLQALSVPCAVFDAGDGAAVASNAAFRREFGDACAARDRRSFESGFESFPADPAHGREPGARGSDAREMFCTATQRWYAFSWRRFVVGGRELELLCVSDLTERMDAVRRHRRQQEQLLFTSRSMSVGEMATMLAHELNQPLAAIINYLATAQCLLDTRADTRGRLPEALAMAREQAERAAGVIAGMREFVQRREPQRSRHDVAALAGHVARLLQLEAQKHRVRVALQIADDLPPVLADRVMIEQVLANLLKNAIEAMRTTPPAQRIATITAGRDADGRIELRVIDRGCGLDRMRAANLFAPFSTSKPDGMGVGLAICRSIVEFHEGSLYHERNEHGGATFAFTLPCAGERGAP